MDSIRFYSPAFSAGLISIGVKFSQRTDNHIECGAFQNSSDMKRSQVILVGMDEKARMAVDILLLDDDAVQGATRKAILERAGHRPVVVSRGSDALKFLQSPEGFSVRMVVTDHLMPGMNGPEFVRAMRKAGYVFPVLVLSGYPDVEDEYKTLDVAFRVKPFPPSELIAFVQFLIDSYHRRTA
jgi:DNA-binding NtrC family response regulator